MGEPADPWELVTAYEPYLGRWSRLVAAEFVAWPGPAGDGAGQGPAPSYVMSMEEPRAALREELRRGLPAEADGSIPLVARAWAVAGICLDSVSR